MHKLTEVLGDDSTRVVWPHVFRTDEMAGPNRLAAAPQKAASGLLLELAEHIGPDYFLLYVLRVGRGGGENGRYQSPPLQLVDVRIFIEEFAEFIENDARHQFWIGSMTNSGLLVYDEHGIIYCYGPIDSFESTLKLAGMRRGEFSIPSPHAHNFHAHYDRAESDLLGRWEWTRSELQPGDAD
jgi:hypothetical protein